ncbi:endonuclease/exonuclease/phosphatase family protein [Cellulomonas sp. P22]|uniref:endonuclease/exonuclease/phosphatase family protein n=1 Tax=Cellulomonas sp. P22 TaxID=3373189 RepID=UPI00378AC4A1
MRLATFNILHGRALTDGRVDLDRFGAAVRALDADVLALQEVDRDQPRSHGADLTEVAAEAMGADAHRFVATMHGEPGMWSAATGDRQPATASYGIALLSRFPVRSWRAVSLPSLRPPALVRFSGTWRAGLVRDEARAALAAVVETPDGPLTVVATHLTFIPGWNVVQLRRLVRGLRSLPRPLVLMGDLNIELRRAALLSGLRPLARGATFPLEAPRHQLDHILADGAITARSDAASLDLGLSDHRALVVDVSLSRASRP